MNIVLNLLKWSPRILGIIFALFIGMFALDVFGHGEGFWRSLAGFLIHLIPFFIIVAILVLSWRWPLAGAVVFLIAGFSYLYWSLDQGRTYPVIYIPMFVTGFLFLISWMFRKQISNLKS